MRITVTLLFSLLLLFSASAQLRDELKNKENAESYSHLFLDIETPVRGCNVAIQHCKQRVGAGQLLTANVTDEDLQLINTDHRQVMVEPPQQPKENNIVQQYVCGQENVCENKNERESEFFQRKNVSDMIGRYDWQIIVVLEDDAVVLQAASSLFKRHASVSTLLRVHKGQILLLRGSRSPLTSNSQVTLVGHGGRGSDGVVRLGGYGAEELARVVRTIGTEIGVVNLVGCKLGKDPQFAKRLLRELRSLGVESRLLLHSTLLSVSLNGEMLTRDEQEGLWRYRDGMTKVIAELDQTGNLLTRVKGGRRGRIVPYYQGYVLARDWPETDHPQHFIPKQYQDKLQYLEALSWAIFIDGGNQICQDFHKDNNLITWKADIMEVDKKSDICIINSIQDVVREISYHAKQTIEKKYVYYKLNQYIYQVTTKDMYVHLVGREGTTREDGFDGYKAVRYEHILSGLGKEKGKKFHWFCYETFNLGKCNSNCYKLGHYFMAAVFAESVRNFRQFGLFLLSSAACNPIDVMTPECDLFVGNNPMARGGSWIDVSKRGFYGWDTITDNLEEVLKAEVALSQCFREKVKNPDLMIINNLGGDAVVINVNRYKEYCTFLKGCDTGKPE